MVLFLQRLGSWIHWDPILLYPFQAGSPSMHCSQRHLHEWFWFCSEEMI